MIMSEAKKIRMEDVENYDKRRVCMAILGLCANAYNTQVTLTPLKIKNCNAVSSDGASFSEAFCDTEAHDEGIVFGDVFHIGIKILKDFVRSGTVPNKRPMFLAFQKLLNFLNGGAFKKKPGTLKCFKEDIEWAMDSTDPEVALTESSTLATEEDPCLLNETSQNADPEVMTTESAKLTTNEDQCLLKENDQNADPEVKTAESFTLATKDQCLLKETGQNTEPEVNLTINLSMVEDPCLPKETNQNTEPEVMTADLFTLVTNDPCLLKDMSQNAEPEGALTESLTLAMKEDPSCLMKEMSQNAKREGMESFTLANKEDPCLLKETGQNAEPEVMTADLFTLVTNDPCLLNHMSQNAEPEGSLTESFTLATKEDPSCLMKEMSQNAESEGIESFTLANKEDPCLLKETGQNAESEVMETESSSLATKEDPCLLKESSQNAEPEVMETESPSLATKENPCLLKETSQNAEPEVMETESSSLATKENPCLLKEMSQNAEPEVMETESSSLATKENPCLLKETSQNAEPEVMETESSSQATKEDPCLLNPEATASESPTSETEDSDPQPEFTSSEDENENDPDFDFVKELKRTQLKRCKLMNLEFSSTSSSDEENNPGLSSDSEEEVVKKSELKRKKLKLSEKISVQGNGSCIRKRVNEDNKEGMYEKTVSSEGSTNLPDQNEEELVNDSDDSDSSVIWPMLSKPSVGSTTNVDKWDSEENDSDHSSIDEDCVTRDKEQKGIYVTRVLKSRVTKNGRVKKSDRVYNSRHPCPFCKKWQTNFSHHILSKQHAEEPEVLEIMKLESSSKERKRLINILRLRGEHQHNVKVIKEKQGELLLARRSVSHSFCIDDYTPCPNCLEWIRISVLKRHQPHCPAKTDFAVSKGSLIIQSKIITGKIDENASKSLVSEVFPIMIEDEVGKVAKTEPLIINLGNQWMQRNVGNRIMRKYYTSSIMRLAARLLIIARQMATDDSISMDSLLQPKYFDVVAQAALKCSKQDESDEEYLQSPSNAVKLGFDIKRMASAKLAMALIGDDQGKKDEAKAFLTLLKIKWGLQVTRLARMVLSEKNFNKSTQLPLPEDVKKLATFMTESLANADTTDESYENFRQIAQLVLARLTLYNRRRCHEVQALRLESYQARKKDADEIAVEMVGELTTFERELLKRQEVVEIRGKTGRGVPVILPQDVKRAMAYLADENVRSKVGIQSCSPYFFANSRAGVFRAYDAIKTVAEAAKLKNPGKMRTSNMRKYMATMLQSLDTTENERQWIIDHLGHTMKIHLNYYRQTSDILERVEIAKLLLIQDMGLVSQYRGKQLKDIQINDILGAKGTEDEEEEEEVPENFENIPNLLDLEEDNEDEDEDKENLAGRKIKKRKCLRQRWTSAEEEELKNLFASFLHRDKCPGQKDVEKAMSLKKCIKFSDQQSFHALSEMERTILVANHLLAQLATSSCYVVDQNSCTGQRGDRCVCGEDSCRMPGEYGDTSIGNLKVWHGNLDVIINNDLAVESVENPPESPGGKSAVKTNLQRNPQIIAQTIVFSFLKAKRHPELEHFLTPCIGIGNSELIILFYDCEHDVLLESSRVPLFEDQYSCKFSYSSILACWLAVNYKTLCSGLVEEFKICKSNFFSLASEKINIYREELKFQNVNSFQTNELKLVKAASKVKTTPLMHETEATILEVLLSLALKDENFNIASGPTS